MHESVNKRVRKRRISFMSALMIVILTQDKECVNDCHSHPRQGRPAWHGGLGTTRRPDTVDTVAMVCRDDPCVVDGGEVPHRSARQSALAAGRSTASQSNGHGDTADDNFELNSLTGTLNLSASPRDSPDRRTGARRY